MMRDDHPSRRPAHDHAGDADVHGLDDHAWRRTEALGYLDGSLDRETIDAVERTWELLADAAPGSRAHARATRARLFWSSLAPVDDEVVDLERWRTSGSSDAGVSTDDGGAAAA